MNISYGPIKQWPGTLRGSRTSAPFKSGLTNTLNLLERELRMIRAQSPVVQLAIAESDWRLDGRPYSNARQVHPGVIVSFLKPVRGVGGTERKIPLSFPADRFTTWESNLRAVALAMEALRLVDRYGVTQNSEQYTGFKALPPPGPSHDDVMTVEDAASFIASHVETAQANGVLNFPDEFRAAYRAATLRLHPDAGYANPNDWAKLQAAKTLLDAHHGGG